MKSLVTIICITGTLATIALSEPNVPATEIASPSPLDELTRLQQEFDRQRAAALRPIAAWYRAQLEALQKSEQSPEVQEAITQALATAREAYWQDDQPELRQALLRQQWIWRSELDANGVVMSFKADGSVTHIGMRGTWRITGPCEVTVLPDDDEKFVLRFNASLSAYEANRRNVSGHRIACVQ